MACPSTGTKDEVSNGNRQGQASIASRRNFHCSETGFPGFTRTQSSCNSETGQRFRHRRLAQCLSVGKVLGHRPDHFIKILRHIRSKERHQPRLVSVQMIVARGNHVADIIPVETCDHNAAASDPEEIFYAQRQLAAKIARSRNPDRVVEAKRSEERRVGKECRL